MNKGIQRALLAALLFGVSAPIAKALVGNVPPQFLAGVLYLGSGGGLLLLRSFRLGAASHSEAPISRADLPFLAGAIAAGGIFAPILLMFGLQRTPAAASALLLNLEAVFTALIAWLIFHENLGDRIVLGMLAIVADGVLLSWSNGTLVLAELIGPLSVVGACLCWAMDNNLTQNISAGDPVQIASWKGLIGGTIKVTAGQRPPIGWFIVAAVGLASSVME
jgi:drug/metabolite transporter (DMT)-like permease